MAQEFVQASFNSGEWAPHLWARTDLEKYKSGAALLENWFVDYRGGASTRSGTRYIIRAYDDSAAVRLIPYQSTLSLGYILEFGDEYVRFHRNGAPVLETGLAITGVDLLNPCVVHVANTYTTGSVDWVYISGITGTTELNGKYFIVSAAAAGTITLSDLFGNPVDATAYGAWISGGTVQRIYTLASPYAAADLALLKFTQNIDSLIICNTNYVPYILTRITDTNWTLAAIVFGSTLTPPTGPFITTNMAGVFTTYYSYVITAVDSNGAESDVSARADYGPSDNLQTNALGTIVIAWTPVTGAQGYNVYKASTSHIAPVPLGMPYGFIGYTTGATFTDSNIAQDFSQPPPTANRPFAGNSVVAVIITNAGSYTGTPFMTFDAAPPGGVTATATPLFKVITVSSIAAGGAGYVVGNTITLINGAILTVLTTGGGGSVTSVSITNSAQGAALVVNPVAQAATSGAGAGATFNLAWGVYSATITNGGSGYISVPAIAFSSGAAAATAVIGPSAVGNPAVPSFFQQRLCLAAPPEAPQTLYFSQPGDYYNFNISIPSQDDDSIAAPIISGQLSTIMSMIAQPGGLIVYTEDITYLINGGSQGAPISPAAITANAQSHIGCNDMPPIVVNFDILTVQSKGSSVRDSTYNFYANVYTGTDISVLSSHLFFGYQLLEWAWAEEPYKVVWAVRDDGALLSLTFIKEQEFTAWTHHYTEKTVDGPQGLFKSVATIVEAARIGYQNFTYFVVARTISGTPVKYIEYFPERATSDTPQDYWCVDCGISYSGTPTTTFSGGEFLAGKTCVGLAGSVPITPFVMPADGNFTLPDPVSDLTIGLQFIADLQTLYIDLGGGPTVQSKMKQIPQITLRVTETLGLKCGSDDSNLVVMKDLTLGQVGGMTNEVVTGLVTGDARTVIDPKWQEQGQIFVRQDQPYPASILGFIPSVNVEGMKG